MRVTSEWLDEMKNQELAVCARRPVGEVISIIVTQEMIDAAQRYLDGLHDPWNEMSLEDIYRVMACLQPLELNQAKIEQPL